MDLLGSIMGGGGMLGGGGSGPKEFGSSTATSTIAGDTVGVQLDTQTLLIGGAAVAGVVLLLGLVFLLKD